jgi:hypothetical protein
MDCTGIALQNSVLPTRGPCSAERSWPTSRSRVLKLFTVRPNVMASARRPGSAPWKPASDRR